MTQLPVVDGFTFELQDGYIGGKYDDWSFYRSYVQGVQGAKAVDLVVVGLTVPVAYFIEVKDYRIDPVTRIPPRRTKPSELHQEVASKVLCSLGGMVAARIRAVHPIEQDVAARACRALSLRVVLHLEQSKGARAAVNPVNVLMKLKKVLKGIDPHAAVVTRERSHNFPWRVRAARPGDAAG
jgi:hypothetical protein